MSYNGSGTFVINSTGQPVVTGTVISSSTFNAFTADIGTGLSTAITKNGQTTTTALIPFAFGISAGVSSSFAAGTVAAPSIYLATDTGTGFYRIGANNNGYSVSGTKLLDFSSALLAVTGAGTFSTTLGVTGTSTLGVVTAGATSVTTLGATGVVSTTARSMLVQPTTATNDGSYKVTNTGGTLFVGLDDSAAAAFGTAGNYGTVIYRPNGTGLAISRTSTVDLAISSAGVVNIPGGLNNTILGATTPAAASVTTLAASSTTRPQGKFSYNGTSGLFLSDATTGAYVSWQIGASEYIGGALSFTPSTAIGGTTFTTPVMSIAATGLSITGTGTFNVSATNPVVINRSSTDPSYGVISFNNVVTTAGMLGVLAGGDSNLYLNAPTGGKVLQRINSVAITDVSSTGLAVTGALSAQGAGVLLAKNNTSDGVYVVGGNISYNAFSISDYGIGSVGALKFASNNAINMTLDASGNLLVGVNAGAASFRARFYWSTAAGQNGLMLEDGSDSSGTAFLYFSENGTGIGSVTRVGATAAVIYNTTSDYRLKNVIGAVSGQGERIDALKPIDYKWKSGDLNSRGFLAHEFQKVYPNSVTGEKDAVDSDGKPKYQAMQASTSEVIADIVAEVQSLRSRVALLEAK